MGRQGGMQGRGWRCDRSSFERAKQRSSIKINMARLFGFIRVPELNLESNVFHYISRVNLDLILRQLQEIFLFLRTYSSSDGSRSLLVPRRKYYSIEVNTLFKRWIGRAYQGRGAIGFSPQ